MQNNNKHASCVFIYGVTDSWFIIHCRVAAVHIYVLVMIRSCVGESMWVFWVVTPGGLVGRYQRYGRAYFFHLQDSMFLRNFVVCLQAHTALRPSRPISTSSLPWEFRITAFTRFQGMTVFKFLRYCIYKERLWRFLFSVIFIFKFTVYFSY